jgi:hypothetical protein
MMGKPMLGSGSARRIVPGIAGAVVAAVLGAAAATLAPAASAATTSATATTPALDGCTSVLAVSSNRVGATVSAVDELDTITSTLTNPGSECGYLQPQVLLSTLPNSVELVWPKVLWRVDGGSWVAAPAQSGACSQRVGDSRDVCATAQMPERLAVNSGTTTVDVAVEFTSWNDANYSFSGISTLYLDSDQQAEFEGQWQLDCATCIDTGTTILPPGVTDGNSPPYTPPASTGGKGSGSTKSGTSPSATAHTAAPHSSAAATVPASTPASTGFGQSGTSSSAAQVTSDGVTSLPTLSAGSAAVDPAALATTDPHSSRSSDSLLTTLCVAVAALVVLGGTALYLGRRRRKLG